MTKEQEILKALSEVKTKLSEEECKKFLSSFGGAKAHLIEKESYLKIEEKYHEDFLHGVKMIMRYGAIAFLNTRQL